MVATEKDMTFTLREGLRKQVCMLAEYLCVRDEVESVRVRSLQNEKLKIKNAKCRM